MLYSKTVMDHFRNPRNVGTIDNADRVGEVGNPICGDMMTIYLKVDDDHISDIKFQTFGCGSAIAVSSMLTEITMGKSVDDAKNIMEALVEGRCEAYLTKPLSRARLEEHLRQLQLIENTL